MAIYNEQKESKFAKPDSKQFIFHMQRRRKKRLDVTPEIEFLTSNGLQLATVNGETINVQG